MVAGRLLNILGSDQETLVGAEDPGNPEIAGIDGVTCTDCSIGEGGMPPSTGPRMRCIPSNQPYGDSNNHARSCDMKWHGTVACNLVTNAQRPPTKTNSSGYVAIPGNRSYHDNYNYGMHTAHTVSPVL